MQDRFLDSKNHAELWKQIFNQMRAAGCQVYINQVINKYMNLKKRWKEALDAEGKTGAGRVAFKFKAEFDEVYGTKASTRPKCVVDSRKPLKETLDNEQGCTGKEEGEGQGTSTGKGKGKGKRHQEGYAEMQESLNKFHQDKMARMDRLLDLYERDIKSRNEDK